MEISARVSSSATHHEASVCTNESSRSVGIPKKATGPGSAVNGGELLMLALATCYCNDLFREAQRLGIPIESAEVEAYSVFPGVGLAAEKIGYRARVQSTATPAEIERLLKETNAVAEIHNTVRQGARVELQSW